MSPLNRIEPNAPDTEPNRLTAKTPIAYPKSLEELEALRQFHGKLIRPQMLGIHAMNSFANKNSPSRSVMFSQHIPQHLVFHGLEKPYIIAGPEYELAKYTFSTKMPKNGTVERVINRYNPSVGSGSVRGIPERTVVYIQEGTGMLDVFHIRKWSSYHQYFGYQNNISPLADQLRPGVTVPEGTVFADTPAVTDDGCYTYGANFETAFIDLGATAEDGIIFSESAIKRARFYVYEEREISFGSNEFPVNSYGDDKTFKIFPDIGEEVRPDGLIAATRVYADRLSAATMSKEDLRDVDHYFDTKRYTRETFLNKKTLEMIQRGEARIVSGRVEDIQVIRNHDTNRMLPPSMTEQLDRYAEALKTYYSELLAVEHKYVSEDRRRGGEGRIPMSPELQNLLVRARAIAGSVGNRLSGTVSLQLNRNTLDEYTVRFVIRHEIEPTIGFKCTGCDGDKGVIVAIWPDEHMPTDVSGRRAEVVASSSSTIDRSNWARNYRPYFAAAARNLTEEIRSTLNLKKNATEEQMAMVDEETFKSVYNRLLLFYAIASPNQFYNYAIKTLDPVKRRLHVLSCVNDKIHLFMPVDNPVNDMDAVIHLNQHFPQVFGKVYYKEEGAEFCWSETDVRIQPVYYMFLEKIADDGSATNIGKLQHHGLLASQTRSEKYTLPYRPGPTRNCGEGESYLFLLYSKTPRAIAEMLDRSNNPATMRTIASVLLRHPTPSNIDKIVDRNQIPYGNTRPLQYLQHFASTQGFWIDYMTEEEAMELGHRENFHAA